MKKYVIILLLFLTAEFVNNQVMAQTTQKVYIGMYCFDRDGVPMDGVPPNDNIGYDSEYLSEMVKYNFNLIIGEDPSLSQVTSSTSRAFLDRIQDSGLKIFLGSKNLYYATTGSEKCAPPPYDYNKVKVGLDFYNTHPAIAGYYLADEPSIVGSPFIGPIINQLAAYDYTKMTFVNLYPQDAAFPLLYCSGPTLTYSDYVDAYIAIGVKMLAFDLYPFYTNQSGCYSVNYFFQNLDVIAKKATDNDLPFYLVGSFRQLGQNTTCAATGAQLGINNLNLLKYNIFGGLIYGSKGIIYWPRENVGGPYTFDEQMTVSTKTDLSAIYKKILNHAPELGGLKYESCFHATSLPLVGSSLIPQVYGAGTDWASFNANSRTSFIFSSTSNSVLPVPTLNPYSPNASDYLAISYLSDAAGQTYMWIMNKKIEGTAIESFTFNFNGPKNIVEVLEDRLCFGASNITFELDPGEAKLFLIRNANVAIETINSAYYDANVTLATSTINLTSSASVNGDSKINFLANQITLNTGVWIHSGTEVLLRSENDYCGTFNRFASEEKPKKIIEAAGLKVIPNPNNGDFTVQVDGDPEKMYTVTVASILGQVVYTKQIPGNGKLDIQLAYLADGMFLVALKSDGEVIQTLKTIVTH